jgi:hypothetical protein
MSLLSRILGRAAATESPIDSVTYDDVGVTRHHANGRVDEVDWADLREVAVMVRGASERHIVLSGKNASTMVHSRVQGVDLLALRLGKLIGFDQEAFDNALVATERARVLCWQRPGTTAAAADAPEKAPAPAPAPAQAPTPAPARTSLELELVPMAGEQAAAPIAAPAATPAATPASAPASAPRPADSAPRLDIAPTRATVSDYAKQAMRDMARVYRVQMDGTIDSLVHIDRAIAELHASGAALESVNKSLYAMGSYAGAVMLRHARGRWVEAALPGASRDGRPDPFLSIELQDGQRWSPISICVDALLSGPDHSLLRTARALLGTQRAASGNS